MGLDNLDGMDKELNLGGRPSKNDNSEETARNPYYKFRANGNPSHDDVDAEEWWKETIDLALDEPLADNEDEFVGQLEVLCDVTAKFPTEVRRALHKHDMYNTNWKEYLAFRPHLFGSHKLPEKWRDRTSGLHYGMSDTIEVNNGDQEPYHDQLENPDMFRDSGRKKRRSNKQKVPRDGAFSGLINDN